MLFKIVFLGVCVWGGGWEGVYDFHVANTYCLILPWNSKQHILVKPETYILSYFDFLLFFHVFPLTKQRLNNICIRILKSHKEENEIVSKI